MCVLSLSFHTILFSLQLLCANTKKVAVQPSPEYKQVETKLSIKKKKKKKDYEELMEEGSNRKP